MIAVDCHNHSATRTQNVLGEKGRRIRELTSLVQKRFNFPEGSVELYAERYVCAHTPRRLQSKRRALICCVPLFVMCDYVWWDVTFIVDCSASIMRLLLPPLQSII